MRYRGVWLVLLALALTTLILVGLRHSANAYSEFWSSFVPHLWANVIGVSLGAMIGIPVGISVNHFFLTLAENRAHRQRCREARDLLQHVRQEVDSHLLTLPSLMQWFPATLDQASVPPGRTQGTQTTKASPEVIASLSLQEISGRRALSDRVLFEVGESLVCFEVSNYYARVGELNRLLNFRIQYGEQRPGTWDRAIQGLVQTVWIARQQVGLEIEHAIGRLGRQASQ